MTTQRTSTAIWTITLFSLLLANGTSAWAQAPAASSEPEQVVSPEQMVDEALKKIDAGDFDQALL